MEITTCKLLPKNKRLKQIFKEHGNEWVIVQEAESVVCLDHGPGLLVETRNGEHFRWVREEDIERI